MFCENRNAKNWRKVKENRGRKRKTSPGEDRNIVTCAKKTPLVSLTAIKNELKFSISISIIRRRLIEGKLRARKPRKAALLNKKQTQSRLSFAHGHVQWNEVKWRNML